MNLPKIYKVNNKLDVLIYHNVMGILKEVISNRTEMGIEKNKLA